MLTRRRFIQALSAGAALLGTPLGWFTRKPIIATDVGYRVIETAVDFGVDERQVVALLQYVWSEGGTPELIYVGERVSKIMRDVAFNGYSVTRIDWEDGEFASEGVRDAWGQAPVRWEGARRERA